MALLQPTRQVQQRTSRVESDAVAISRSVALKSHANESQTWVLFSPATDAGTTTSYIGSLQDDNEPTPGRSRISDLGSLGTVERCDIDSIRGASIVQSDVLDDSIAEDDTELDSLDSHLPEFRSRQSPYSKNSQQGGPWHAAPVLPAHDGLGTFPLGKPGLSAETQDELYAFEKYNSRRVKRRRESLESIKLELGNEQVQESERHRWIEAWRLEQSHLLLQEVQRETRRIRKSKASGSSRSRTAPVADEAISTGEAARDMPFTAEDWHELDAPGVAIAPDGLLSRITRKVLGELLGIDDKLLSELFGEVLPDDGDLSSTSKAPSGLNTGNSGFAPGEAVSSVDSDWSLHLLERLSRELGVLVHQLSSHPGAFSTYARMQQTPLPYAGLPVIPEAAVDASEPAVRNETQPAPSAPEFRPTVLPPIDMESRQRASQTTMYTEDLIHGSVPARVPQLQTFTQQEWEQDLDIKLVFRYLRSRFSGYRSSSPGFTSGTSHLATSSTQDAAAKAARVFRHHPLVSHMHARGHPHQRSRPTERRTFKANTSSSPAGLRLTGGSCASQSTRRSARQSSISSRHSSRHYWDMGGSIGTGSMIASAGAMGSWGEV